MADEALTRSATGAMARIAFTGCDVQGIARPRSWLRRGLPPGDRGNRSRPGAAGARLRTAGVSQLVVGTDHQIPWQSKSVDHILKAPRFTAAERRARLGETAAKLLRIKP